MISKRNYSVLFVSSSGKVFKLIPFIKSQHDSLKPHVRELDHFRIETGGLKGYFSAIKELRSLLKAGRYDIVHAHWTYAGILCSVLVKHERLIVSFMGNDLQGIYSRRFNLLTLKGFVNILLSQILMLKVDGIIVKSRRMLSWVPFYVRRKTEIIPNGIDLEKFKVMNQAFARRHLNLKIDGRYILFLGSVTDENKNFKLLQKALEYLDARNVQYTLLSPYPTDSSLIPYYLAASNVLAFCSKLEGSPNVVKEALAATCSIVATDVGDIKERIGKIEGCHIARFDERDFANKLMLAIEFNRRIDSSEQLLEISEPHIASRIIELYDKTLTRSKP